MVRDWQPEVNAKLHRRRRHNADQCRGTEWGETVLRNRRDTPGQLMAAPRGPAVETLGPVPLSLTRIPYSLMRTVEAVPEPPARGSRSARVLRRFRLLPP